MLNSMNKCMAWGAAVLLAAGMVQGAEIRWNPAVNVSGDGSADVSTKGSLLYGVSFYTPRGNNPSAGYVDGTSTTVNGVRFDLPTIGGSVSVEFRSQTMDNNIRKPVPEAVSGGSAYEKLFLSNTWEANEDRGRFTLNHLEVGVLYEVQVFAGDARYSSGQVTEVDGMPLDVGRGQYLIGTFMADASSQHITIGGEGILTALQVRNVLDGISLGLINY